MRPHAPAQIQGQRRLSWAAFDRRAAGVATTLLDAGLAPPAKVALLLYNCPEYLEATFACFKCGLVPVNTNYRYKADELVYLWDNADAEAVVFHDSFKEQIAAIQARLPKIRSWLCVDDGSGNPGWAQDYEAAARARPAPESWRRSPDDVVLFYTGGTTGMPKGVLWRQDDLFRAETADLEIKGDTAPGDVALVAANFDAAGAVSLPASPLMHGTGFYSQLGVLSFGGAVVTLEGRHFDSAEVLSTIAREKVKKLVIVGDVFAGPLLRALDAQPDRWDISSLETIVSSGAIWSRETKAGLLRHNPAITLWDSLGSSEAFGLARSISTVDTVSPTACFVPTKNVCLFDDVDRAITTPGTTGRIAVKGPAPLGYYKDTTAGASVFVEVDGERFVISGDWARLEADGTLTLLGRGSSCINTGGEKVFPEEVEVVIRELAWVEDVVVVGVPDEHWGEAVAAVVEAPEAEADADELIAHVKSRIAGFKAPRHVVFAAVHRGPNGKVSYRLARETAQGALTPR